ncbi:hypothetical protein BU17DRAFT_72210 [Hysterangium stoloniferum]|nr:hypothetical protein BU17DRAFT_72210 [Hysterangium stoloniferum]
MLTIGVTKRPVLLGLLTTPSVGSFESVVELRKSSISPDSSSPPAEEEQLLECQQIVATEEWVKSWRKGLPMDSVLLAVTELLPLIQSSSPPSVALLASTILVGILPPPAIISHRFQWMECSKVWRKAIANVTSAAGNMWSAIGGGRTGQPGTGSPRSSRDGGEGGMGRRQ